MVDGNQFKETFTILVNDKWEQLHFERSGQLTLLSHLPCLRVNSGGDVKKRWTEVCKQNR